MVLVGVQFPLPRVQLPSSRLRMFTPTPSLHGVVFSLNTAETFNYCLMLLGFPDVLCNRVSFKLL